MNSFILRNIILLVQTKYLQNITLSCRRITGLKIVNFSTFIIDTLSLFYLVHLYGSFD